DFLGRFYDCVYIDECICTVLVIYCFYYSIYYRKDKIYHSAGNRSEFDWYVCDTRIWLGSIKVCCGFKLDRRTSIRSNTVYSTGDRKSNTIFLAWHCGTSPFNVCGCIAYPKNKSDKRTSERSRL